MAKILEYEGQTYEFKCPFGDGECYGNEKAVVFTDRNGKVDLFIPRSTADKEFEKEKMSHAEKNGS